MRALIVLFAILAAPSGASSASAKSEALAWLQNHAGSPDQLAELKSANPEAYALVNALLTKRSLGLLNAKDPTASFSHSAPAAEPVERGPQAFANLATPTTAYTAKQAMAPEIALPYAGVKSANHDWLNWKPHSSAADETMVASVLSMVGGAKSSQAAPEADAPQDAAISEPSPVVAEPAPKAASSWGHIGSMLGMHKNVQHKDWLNWKPHSGAADDAMVANVLSMVGGAKGARAAPEVSSPVDTSADFASVQPSAPEVAESAPKATSGWGDIGSMLGLHKKVQHKAPVPVMYAEAAEHSSSESQPREVSQMVAPKTNAKDWKSMQAMKQNSDDKAVTNLLNMVAQLKGGKNAEKLLKKHHAASSEDSALSNDLAAFGDTPEETPVTTQSTAEIAAPVFATAALAEPSPPATAKEDSWRSIGGMFDVQEKPHRRAVPTQTVSVASEVSAPLEVIAAPAHEDKDEKAVNSLLNMVAQLKGGKAAAILSRKHHIDAEDAPVASPTVEASAPKEQDSWGSIGGMWGVRHQATPIKTTDSSDVVQRATMSAMPTEVQALLSADDAPVHRPVPQAAKVDDYKVEADKKQNSDDKAVKSLLSMVAQLRGSKKAAKLAEKYDHGSTDDTQDNSLSRDMVSWNGAATDDAPAESAPVELAPVAQVEVPSTPTSPERKKTKNMFLDSLTSSLSAPEQAPHHVPALAKENSYLKAFGLEPAPQPVAKVAFATSSSNNILASWFSDSSEEKVKPKEKVQSANKASKLLSWLDPEQPDSISRAAAVAEPQAPVNPYLADLS